MWVGAENGERNIGANRWGSPAGVRQASQSTRQASCRIVPKDIQEYHFANWQRWLPLARATISSRSSKRRAMMTFRPLHDRVLVRRIEAAEKTAGGIII